MLRCATIAAALFLAAITAAPSARAQAPRPFPANALRGEIEVVQPPALLLDGKPARFAPGVRVRGQNNLLLTQGALAGGKWLVHYTRDASGALAEVWVLTPAELANQPWPATPEQAASWGFDPLAQRWIKP
jgi:hypothetical protein